jgi:hypothetical protein
VYISISEYRHFRVAGNDVVVARCFPEVDEAREVIEYMNGGP